MKLILANNQGAKFRAFYDDLRSKSAEPFDYSGYSSLLFAFNLSADQSLIVHNQDSGNDLTAYDGVYINGYLNTYELAASVAIACEALGIGYVDRELQQPPSLSKLSMYAKLAAAGLPLPPTLAGTKQALLQATDHITRLPFPAVLKRADADRGIDNYKLASADEVVELLRSHEERSLWLLQAYIPNNGYYRLGFYDQTPAFCIFRELQARPDGDAHKAHMYRPKGGANATLIELSEVPAPIIETCQKALLAMNRQIGGVDCLYDPANQTVQVLEVNYNPQLVTIETFKDVRVQAFLDYVPKLGRSGLEKV